MLPEGARWESKCFSFVIREGSGSRLDDAATSAANSGGPAVTPLSRKSADLLGGEPESNPARFELQHFRVATSYKADDQDYRKAAAGPAPSARQRSCVFWNG